MRILLLGKNGQVGWELNRHLASLGELVALSRQDLDLTDITRLRAVIRDIRPDLIVNASAYTHVDQAEHEEEIAYQVNAKAVEVMASEAERLGIAIVHYSTDYIFDGEKGSPYTEDDRPNPINAYGRTKLAGENFLRQSKVPNFIFRTEWIYGTRGKNFLLTILKLSREREELKIVNDQIGSPTWCRFISETTAEILFRGIENITDFFRQYGGIYHLTASGSTTWYEFAKMITELDPNNREQVCRRIIPIMTEEYPAPAKRPKFSVLDNKKIEKTFKLKMQKWDKMLQNMIYDLNLKDNT